MTYPKSNRSEKSFGRVVLDFWAGHLLSCPPKVRSVFVSKNLVRLRTQHVTYSYLPSMALIDGAVAAGGGEAGIVVRFGIAVNASTP